MAKTIVFIDSRVNDLDLLVSQFETGTEYRILDAQTDEVLQIEEALTGKSDYDSIQIISHSSSGSISIGGTVLSSINLLDYKSHLETIGHVLTDHGDLLLYGCNVGAGEVGHRFIDILSHLTNADVAASDNLTGSAAMGGDWKLEVSTGPIESNTPFINSNQQHYDHVLDYSEDYDLAELSLLAYYDDPSQPKENDSSNQTIAEKVWNKVSPNGWSQLEPRDSNGDYSATAFQKGDTIVIAYRGTRLILG